MEGSHSKWSNEIRKEINQMLDQLGPDKARLYLDRMNLAGLIEVKFALKAIITEEAQHTNIAINKD